MMLRRNVVSIISFLVALQCSAAIPLVMNHQGFVQVNSAPYTGVGEFKFVIFDADDNILWSNDDSKKGENVGSLGSPNNPNNPVDITVNQGTYAIGLGDSTVVNMTALSSSIFESDEVYLRIIFDDGVNGEVALGDQRITSTAYSFHAATADSASYAVGVDGYVHGGVISNNSGDVENDLDITAGTFRSDDNTFNIVCIAMTKRADASWVAGSGQGGLDQGSITVTLDQMIYIWAIGDSTGANGGDYLFSTSGTAPLLPAGYDKKRLIGGRAWNWDGATGGFRRFHTHGVGKEKYVAYLEYASLFGVDNRGVDGSKTGADLSRTVPIETSGLMYVHTFVNGTGDGTNAMRVKWDPDLIANSWEEELNIIEVPSGDEITHHNTSHAVPVLTAAVGFEVDYCDGRGWCQGFWESL